MDGGGDLVEGGEDGAESALGVLHLLARGQAQGVVLDHLFGREVAGLGQVELEGVGLGVGHGVEQLLALGLQALQRVGRAGVGHEGDVDLGQALGDGEAIGGRGGGKPGAELGGQHLAQFVVEEEGLDLVVRGDGGFGGVVGLGRRTGCGDERQEPDSQGEQPGLAGRPWAPVRRRKADCGGGRSHRGGSPGCGELPVGAAGSAPVPAGGIDGAGGAAAGAVPAGACLGRSAHSRAGWSAKLWRRMASSVAAPEESPRRPRAAADSARATPVR
jgi:hypothetical protein